MKYLIQIPFLKVSKPHLSGGAIIWMILAYKYPENIKILNLEKILEAYGIAEGLDIGDEAIQMGLERADIKFNHHSTKAKEKAQLQYLNKILKKKNVFILNTERAGKDFWVLVVGKSDLDVFLLIDPMYGFFYYSDEQIIELWKPKKFNGFEIILDEK